MLTQHAERIQEFKRYQRPTWWNVTSLIKYEDVEKVSIDVLKKLEAHYTEIEKHNRKVSTNNRKVEGEYREAFLSDLVEAGIDPFGVRGGVNAPFKNIINAVSGVLRRNEPCNPVSGVVLVVGIDIEGKPVSVNSNGKGFAARIEDLKIAGKRMEEERTVNDLMLKACVAYGKKVELYLSDYSSVDAFKEDCNNRFRKAFLKQNYPVGTAVSLKNECDECSTYIVGDRRCSCGNVRLEMVVEGDLLNKPYAYPEKY